MLLKTEFKKIISTKIHLLYFFIILIAFLIQIVVNLKYPIFTDLISVYSDIINFGMYFSLPMLTILFYSHFIPTEFSNNTLKYLINSIYTKSHIILSKFITASIVYLFILIGVNFVTLIVLYAIYGTFQTPIGSYNTLKITDFKEFLTSTIIINLSVYMYVLVIGVLTFLMSIVFKKRFVTVITTLALFLIIRSINIPVWLKPYTFLGIPDLLPAFWDLQYYLFYILQVNFGSLSFIFIILYIVIFIFEKYKSQRRVL